MIARAFLFAVCYPAAWIIAVHQHNPGKALVVMAVLVAALLLDADWNEA